MDVGVKQKPHAIINHIGVASNGPLAWGWDLDLVGIQRGTWE
jgi:hypothetical protein